MLPGLPPWTGHSTFRDPCERSSGTASIAQHAMMTTILHSFISESRNRVQRRSSSPGYRQRRRGHKKVPPVSLRCLFAEGLEIEVIENGHAHRDEHEGVNRLGDPLDA